jgi:hypothetical protein
MNTNQFDWLHNLNQLTVGKRYDLYVNEPSNEELDMELIDIDLRNEMGTFRKPASNYTVLRMLTDTAFRAGIRLARVPRTAEEWEQARYGTLASPQGGVLSCSHSAGWKVTPGFLVNYENCATCGHPKEGIDA